MNRFNLFTDWTGAILLALAPFFIDYSFGKLFAIFGLLLLTNQAFRNGLYNLVMLNTIGIIGYSWSLLI